MTRDRLLTRLARTIAGIDLAHPVRVAIDGVDASGKSTLADELASTLRHRGRRVVRASIDGFHNPGAVRRRRGDLSPEGYYRDSFNYAALVGSLLEPLGPGGSGRYRRSVFDHRSDRPVASPVEHAPSDAVLLFDGVFLMRPELRAQWDFSIYVRAAFDVTLGRAERRDRDLFGGVARVRERYRRRYVPGQRIYLAEVQPERRASVVIDNDDPTNPRVVSAA